VECRSITTPPARPLAGRSITSKRSAASNRARRVAVALGQPVGQVIPIVATGREIDHARDRARRLKIASDPPCGDPARPVAVHHHRPAPASLGQPRRDRAVIHQESFVEQVLTEGAVACVDPERDRLTHE